MANLDRGPQAPNTEEINQARVDLATKEAELQKAHGEVATGRDRTKIITRLTQEIENANKRIAELEGGVALPAQPQTPENAQAKKDTTLVADTQPDQPMVGNALKAEGGVVDSRPEEFGMSKEELDATWGKTDNSQSEEAIAKEKKAMEGYQKVIEGIFSPESGSKKIPDTVPVSKEEADKFYEKSKNRGELLSIEIEKLKEKDKETAREKVWALLSPKERRLAGLLEKSSDGREVKNEEKFNEYVDKKIEESGLSKDKGEAEELFNRMILKGYRVDAMKKREVHGNGYFLNLNMLGQGGFWKSVFDLGGKSNGTSWLKMGMTIPQEASNGLNQDFYTYEDFKEFKGMAREAVRKRNEQFEELASERVDKKIGVGETEKVEDEKDKVKIIVREKIDRFFEQEKLPEGGIKDLNEELQVVIRENIPVGKRQKLQEFANAYRHEKHEKYKADLEKKKTTLVEVPGAEQKPKPESVEDSGEFALYESLLKKEQDKTITIAELDTLLLNMEFEQVKENNTPIKIDGLFDIKKELKKVITNETLSKEEKKLLKESLIEKHLKQEKALADFQMLVERKIKHNPDIEPEKLREWVHELNKEFVAEYGFNNKQNREIKKRVDVYCQQHKKVTEVREKHKSNVALINELVGEDLLAESDEDKFIVSVGPNSINIEAKNEVDMDMIFREAKDPVLARNINYVGFTSRSKQGGVIYTVTTNKKENEAHEVEGHAKEGIFEEIYEDRFKQDKKELLNPKEGEAKISKEETLERYLVFERDYALRKAKDEMFAMSFDGLEGLEGKIVKSLSATQDQDYDFAKEARETPPKGFKNDKEFKEKVQKILVEQYNKDIAKAAKAFIGLIEKFSQEKAINLLRYKDLASWESAAERLSAKESESKSPESTKRAEIKERLKSSETIESASSFDELKSALEGQAEYVKDVNRIETLIVSMENEKNNSELLRMIEGLSDYINLTYKDTLKSTLLRLCGRGLTVKFGPILEKRRSDLSKQYEADRQELQKKLDSYSSTGQVLKFVSSFGVFGREQEKIGNQINDLADIYNSERGVISGIAKAINKLASNKVISGESSVNVRGKRESILASENQVNVESETVVQEDEGKSLESQKADLEAQVLSLEKELGPEISWYDVTKPIKRTKRFLVGADRELKNRKLVDLKKRLNEVTIKVLAKKVGEKAEELKNIEGVEDATEKREKLENEIKALRAMSYGRENELAMMSKSKQEIMSETEELTKEMTRQNRKLKEVTKSLENSDTKEREKLEEDQKALVAEISRLEALMRALKDAEEKIMLDKQKAEGVKNEKTLKEELQKVAGLSDLSNVLKKYSYVGQTEKWQDLIYTVDNLDKMTPKSISKLTEEDLRAVEDRVEEIIKDIDITLIDGLKETFEKLARAKMEKLSAGRVEVKQEEVRVEGPVVPPVKAEVAPSSEESEKVAKYQKLLNVGEGANRQDILNAYRDAFWDAVQISGDDEGELKRRDDELDEARTYLLQKIRVKSKK